MPEGPEVSYMKYYLQKKFINTSKKTDKSDKIKTKKPCYLTNLHILGGRYSRHGNPKEFNEFQRNLPSKILDIDNKGKLLYIKLENNLNIVITLGLTGIIKYECEKHCHYKFDTSCGHFYLKDKRNFGTISFMNDVQLEDKLNTIGPDLLNQKITFQQFSEKVNTYPEKEIGIVLLNQKLFSGIGNYIRCEALYEAKISPFRLIKNINSIELKLLFNKIKTIMKNAYNSHIENNYHKSYQFKVYKRTLTNKNEKVIRQKLEKGRNVYWVPSVQK